MRLDDARLCLDCEEIHEEQECPACGSEAFGFLTRWIQSTSAERQARASLSPQRQAPQPRPEQSTEHLDAWRQIVSGVPADEGRSKKIVTRGLLGLAAMGLASWVWRKSERTEETE